jgi:hypothetical protein
VSLAGIAAVEKIFPCIKIERSFAKTIKPKSSGCGAVTADVRKISSLTPLWPYLDQVNISYAEQDILYRGVQLLEKSFEHEGQVHAFGNNDTSLISNDDTSLINNNDTSLINNNDPFPYKDFANIYAKILLIGTEATNRVVLSEGSSTC